MLYIIKVLVLQWYHGGVCNRTYTRILFNWYDKISRRRRIKPEQEMVFFLLVLNAPILFFLLFWYFNTIQTGGLQMYEYVGLTLTTGMYIGAVGINVAHELGHRTDLFLTMGF